jgi:hypothetical protein
MIAYQKLTKKELDTFIHVKNIIFRVVVINNLTGDDFAFDQFFITYP